MLNEHLKSLENEFLAEYSSRDFLYLHHLVSLKEELSKKVHWFYKPAMIYREEFFKAKGILLTTKIAKTEFYNLKKGFLLYKVLISERVITIYRWLAAKKLL